MSGGWVPYHLRKNKAIDRAIFMEFLTKLNAFNPICNYGYVGFGAIHLEDFKLIHSLFSINDLTCIEIDQVIHNRQKFNLPLGCINLEHTSSDSFIANFFPDKNYVIWLDYASPKQIGQQINELYALLQKMNEFDVIKITLNANPNTIVDEKQFRLKKHVLEQVYEPEELYEGRLKELKSRIEYFPHDITVDMMNKKKYPHALCKILELTCISALDGMANSLQPVSSFVYADSEHQMLTLTGVILGRDFQEEFISKLDLHNWEYSCTTWGPPHLIDIPDLTLKERLMIDSFLPCDNPDQIISSLDIQFDLDEQRSIEKIKNYVRYYRHYPFFSKVSV